MSKTFHAVSRIAGVVALVGLVGMVALPTAYAKNTTQEGKCSIKSSAPKEKCEKDRGKSAKATATGSGVHDTCTTAKKEAANRLRSSVSNTACMAHIDCGGPCRTVN